MVNPYLTPDPESRSYHKKGTTYISGVTFGPKKVEYEIINGLAIFEGDIILGKAEYLENDQGSRRSCGSNR